VLPRLVLTLLAAAALLMAAAVPAQPAAKKYRGFVSLSGKPVHDGSQGAGWTLSFRERATGRVRYKACLKNLSTGSVRCFRRRTPASGRQNVFVALYVNDVGGPGRWRARWFVRGVRVAEWRFRVRPETTGP
jgi:hypothetical protein